MKIHRKRKTLTLEVSSSLKQSIVQVSTTRRLETDCTTWCPGVRLHFKQPSGQLPLMSKSYVGRNTAGMSTKLFNDSKLCT